MVVIVLIGLLAGAVTMGTRAYLISGKQSVAKLEISRVCQALDTFYSTHNRYPTNEEGLATLAKPDEKLGESLLSQVPVDPWGNSYEYIQPGRQSAYEVICYGADGLESGEGANRDIRSTDLNDNATGN